MDLVILGFDDLVPIIDIKFGGEEKMRDSGLSDQADQIYTVIPQIKVINYKFFFQIQIIISINLLRRKLKI